MKFQRLIRHKNSLNTLFPGAYHEHNEPGDSHGGGRFFLLVQHRNLFPVRSRLNFIKNWGYLLPKIFYKIRLQVLISALLLFFISDITVAATQAPPLKKFIAIADIHFNPFIGCDTDPSICPMLSELRIADVQAWDAIFHKYIDNIQTRYRQDTDGCG